MKCLIKFIENIFYIIKIIKNYKKYYFNNNSRLQFQYLE